jgi:hypothetical protein
MRRPSFGFDLMELTRKVRHPNAFGEPMICPECHREASENAAILFHAPDCRGLGIIKYREFLDKEGIPF